MCRFESDRRYSKKLQQGFGGVQNDPKKVTSKKPDGSLMAVFEPTVERCIRTLGWKKDWLAESCCPPKSWKERDADLVVSKSCHALDHQKVATKG